MRKHYRLLPDWTGGFCYVVWTIVVFLLLTSLTSAVTTIDYTTPSAGLKVEIEQGIVDAFNATHDDIQVKLNILAWRGDEDYAEKIAVWFVSGATPDVFKVTPPNVASVAERGCLYNLTSLVERDANEIDLDDFMITGPGYRHGRHYVMSYRVGYTATNVNLDKFAQAGLPSPFETFAGGGWDWEFLQTAATKLTERDQEDRVTSWGYGLIGWNRLPDSAWLQSAGADWFDETGTKAVFDSIEALEVFRFLRSLVERGVMPGRNSFGLNYNVGDYAIATSSQGLPGGYTGDWRTEVLPHFAGPATGPVLATYTVDDVAISSLSRNKAAAWEFVKFYVSPETITRWIQGFRAVPNRRSLLEVYLPIMEEQWSLTQGPKLLAESLGRSQVVLTPLPPHSIDFRRILMQELWPGLFGEVPLITAVQNAVRLVDVAAAER